MGNIIETFKSGRKNFIFEKMESALRENVKKFLKKLLYALILMIKNRNNPFVIMKIITKSDTPIINTLFCTVLTGT